MTFGWQLCFLWFSFLFSSLFCILPIGAADTWSSYYFFAQRGCGYLPFNFFFFLICPSGPRIPAFIFFFPLSPSGPRIPAFFLKFIFWPIGASDTCFYFFFFLAHRGLGYLLSFFFSLPIGATDTCLDFFFHCPSGVFMDRKLLVFVVRCTIWNVYKFLLLIVWWCVSGPTALAGRWLCS